MMTRTSHQIRRAMAARREVWLLLALSLACGPPVARSFHLSVPDVVAQLQHVSFSFPTFAQPTNLLPPMEQLVPVPVDQLLDATGQVITEASDEVIDAILPRDLADCASIVLSEFAAGAIAGVATKEVAVLDGNSNSKDTFVTSAETSGLFFAAQGGLRAATQLLGMTTPLVGVIVLLLATALSEEIKILSRNSGGSNGSGDLSPTSFFGNVTTTEVVADVSKWIVYDLTLPMEGDISSLMGLDAAVQCGALAGIVSQVLREAGGDFTTMTVRGVKESPVVRVARSAVEGAIQFLTYEVSRQVRVRTFS